MADMPGWIWTTPETRRRELERRRSSIWANECVCVFYTLAWVVITAWIILDGGR